MCRGEPWGVRAIQCMCAAHGLRTTPLHATTPPVQSSPLHHTPRLANRKVEGSRNTFPIQLKGHTSQTRIRSKTLPVSHSNNNNCYFGPWTPPHSIQLQPLSHSTPLHSTPPLGDRKGCRVPNTFPIQLKGHISQTKFISTTLPVILITIVTLDLGLHPTPSNSNPSPLHSTPFHSTTWRQKGLKGPHIPNSSGS